MLEQTSLRLYIVLNLITRLIPLLSDAHAQLSTYNDL